MQKTDNQIPTFPPEFIEGILKLDNQLCFALYAASRLIVQSYGPMLAELNLTYPQYIVMLVLWERDGLTVKELGEKLFLDSGTLTPVLSKLEDIGYVARERSKTDDRRVLNFLTDKSRALKAEAAKVPTALLCQSGMSYEQFCGIRDTIRALLPT